MYRKSTRPLTLLIKGYQWFVSPWLGHNCRFNPSCATYALESLEKHGYSKGGLLALKRLGRCHPWGGMGEDPVPEAKTPINNTRK